MCGSIAGTIGARDPALVERMLEVLRHRGPDGNAHWSVGAARLGMARLVCVIPLPAPASDE